MKVRYSPQATRDLASIHEYLTEISLHRIGGLSAMDCRDSPEYQLLKERGHLMTPDERKEVIKRMFRWCPPLPPPRELPSITVLPAAWSAFCQGIPHPTPDVPAQGRGNREPCRILAFPVIPKRP
jgi:hypothetical protein